MRTISACIITDNNPKVLNAIESVYNSVDEIILVNTNGDFTHDISKLDKVKLDYFDWNDSFSDARNYAKSKATGDYILTIDSDETLKSGDLKKLLDENTFDFYFTKILNGNEYYINIRLFRNCKEIFYENMIHESVEQSCKTLSGAKTNIVFTHNGYELSPDEMKLKAERNFRILCKDVNNIGRNIHFAKHYNAVGDYTTAIDYANKALEQKDINEDNKAILCILIYDCYKKLGGGEAGLDYLRASIEIFPMQIMARYLICNFLYNLKDREKHKEILLKQLVTIGSLITFKNSELSNDIYCDIKIINKMRGEIEKWQ